MPVIYKYPIEPTTKQTKTEPYSWYPLHVGTDPIGEPCVWVEADLTVPVETSYDFYVVATGSEVPDVAECYLGTVHQEHYVWHIFYTEVSANG